MFEQVYSGVTSEAVKKGTGKSWDEWFEIIDREGGEKMTHKEIVQMLYDEEYIKSGWWCQSVTVGYEYKKGRRILGQTTEGFQVGVQKIFPISKEDLWKLLTSKEGVKTWLGEVSDYSLSKGYKFKTKDEVEGEVTVLKENSHFRMKWKLKSWKDYSTLQVRIMPKGENKASLTFHHEKLKGPKERKLMKSLWTQVLEKLEKKI